MSFVKRFSTYIYFKGSVIEGSSVQAYVNHAVVYHLADIS